jgi:hypothetical protein
MSSGRSNTGTAESERGGRRERSVPNRREGGAG